MSQTSKSALRRLYPESGAGGYSHVDGTVAFCTRINALLERHMTVLDFGAGRGAQLEETACPYRRDLAILRGKSAKVIGVDVDPVVMENPFLDQGHVIEPAAPLPLA